MNTIQQEAIALSRAGITAVALASHSKKPIATNWPTRQFNINNFRANNNLGVLLGERSGGLLCVDLDDPIALQLSDEYLPPTPAIAGRPSSPRSHRFYRCPGVESRRLSLPGHGRVVELLSSGTQVVVGPSTHPETGEQYDRLRGEPATVDAETLIAAIERLHQAVAEHYGVEASSKIETPKPPAPWERPIQPAPEPDSLQTTPQPEPMVSVGQVGVNLERQVQRSIAFILAYPGAISGERGHDCLLYLVQVLIHRFKLPPGVALQLLMQYYNAKCEPQWTEKELQHKVEEAIKHPANKVRDWEAEEAINTPNLANARQSVDALLAGATACDWPEIVPLDRLPDAPTFDPMLLPGAIRPWIEDIAERTQAPIDYPAIAAIVGLASVAGRQCMIRPKRCDDWGVVPNLWGALVGVPSAMKTPSLQAALAPIRKMEVEAKRDYAKAMAEWEQLETVRDEQAKIRQKQIRQSLASGDGDLKKLTAIGPADDSRAPTRRRYVLNDSTTEKAGEIARDNPVGFLQLRDELIGFLRGLDKSGREQDRAFYLEAWNGNSRFTYDRIGRGTLDIEALCVSIIGCTQPGPWGAYVREAVIGGAGADGLLQRFQLAVWPESSKQWRNVDRWPDSAAKTRAYRVFEQLGRLPTGIGDRDEFDDLPYLRFSPAAQEMFDDWRSRLEHHLRSGSLNEVMEAHLAKYRSLIPSLALVSSLADGHYDCVADSYVDSAIRMGSYLEGHAKKLYASVMVGKDSKAAAALLSRIMDRQLQDGFTARDIYRREWSLLSSKDDADRAIGVLVRHGYLASRSIDTGGKPKNEYRVNPATFSR